MDILNDILDTLNLKGALYFRTDFSGAWSVAVPELGGAARFHMVIQGRCHLEIGEGSTLILGPGDLVLIPQGRAHILADEAGREAPSLETVLQDTDYDGSGVLAVGAGDPLASTQMVCGHFTFRDQADHPILRALPEYLVTTMATRAREPWLDEMLRLIVRRVFSDDIGSPAAVTRLSEIVFIELLRVGIDQSGALGSIIAGFQDRHIGRALELIHARPSMPWTVEKLATEVGMSRSRFAERFSHLMGSGPMALSVRLATTKSAGHAGVLPLQCSTGGDSDRLSVSGGIQSGIFGKIRRCPNPVSAQFGLS